LQLLRCTKELDMKARERGRVDATRSSYPATRRWPCGPWTRSSCSIEGGTSHKKRPAGWRSAPSGRSRGNAKRLAATRSLRSGARPPSDMACHARRRHTHTPIFRHTPTSVGITTIGFLPEPAGSRAEGYKPPDCAECAAQSAQST
jgi:hypothetical protein